MKENLDLLPLKLKGHVKVEMFDKEGKLVYKQEGDNYISHGVNAMLRRVQLTWLTSGLPHNMNRQYSVSGGTNNPILNDGTVYFAKYLVLTDYDAPADAMTDAMLRGNVIGWCATTEQSYSDPNSGLLNVAESYVDLDRIHLVFDFATDRANGTFRSAYLANNYESMRASEIPLTPILKLARQYSSLCYYDSYLWGRSSNIVYKINPATGEEMASYDIGETIYESMCVYGGYIYYCTYNSLKKYNISDGTKATVVSAGNSNNYVTTDGTYLYLCRETNIRKIEIATGTQVGSKTLPVNIASIFCRNSVLYGYYNGISYIIDFDAGTATPTEFGSAGKQIAFDGTNDYVIDNYSTVYKRQGSNITENIYMLCTTSLFSKSGIDIFSRYRFASDVTKDNTQTMKITYDVEFS